jgi:hypothetical protein
VGAAKAGAASVVTAGAACTVDAASIGTAGAACNVDVASGVVAGLAVNASVATRGNATVGTTGAVCTTDVGAGSAGRASSVGGRTGAPRSLGRPGSGLVTPTSRDGSFCAANGSAVAAMQRKAEATTATRKQDMTQPFIFKFMIVNGAAPFKFNQLPNFDLT